MATEDSDFDKRGALSRALITGLAAGPLDIMASLGTGEALLSGSLAAIVGILGEKAVALDGRRKVVAAGFSGMDPADVDHWLDQDTRHVTLAVQAVLRATAAFDESKIDALGRAFRAGVLDEAKVDESLFVVAALGTLERPHIDVLRVLATEVPNWDTEPEGGYPLPVQWDSDGLTRRMPHLGLVMPLLLQHLQTGGITELDEVSQPNRRPVLFGPFLRLTRLGRLCVEYLSIFPTDQQHSLVEN